MNGTKELVLCWNKDNVAINHRGVAGDENKNVLIKNVNAGLVQPGWVQRHQGRCPELPSGTPGRHDSGRSRAR